ncbi:alpha/beta fold hydrolase [Amycolatopsis lurida]
MADRFVASIQAVFAGTARQAADWLAGYARGGSPVTTFVLVHGAWHGPWAWDQVVPLLHAAGARALTPDLSVPGDHGLHDHAEAVIAAIDKVQDDDDLVLVGHSYAGLVVREAADARPDTVGHVVLVDGWAGTDGASMFSLAP